ncbi:MAG: ribonuclease III [Microgenomates group bacterium]
MHNLNLLEKQIGVSFKNKKLLENAFIHRSYLNEHKSHPLPSNEKLEFLGDSVLSLITSMYLYSHYPALHEGDYTEIKSAIVKTGSLADASRKLELGKYLFLSRGEEAGQGRENTNILADCFEALIAAIFIDQGFDTAYDFVEAYLFGDQLERIVDKKEYFAAKSKLQEVVQAKYKQTPLYKTLKEEGPEHDRTFTVSVSVRDKEVGVGTGKSKKEAEERAATKALEKLRVEKA